MNSSPRVAIVTGAAGKIGSAITRRLLEDGVNVVLADIDEEALGTTIANLHPEQQGSATGVAVDLRSVDSIRSLARNVGDRFGRVDIVVNNAAVNKRTTLAGLNQEAWDEMSSVNLRAPAFLISSVLDLFTSQHHGTVINVGSRTWVSGGPVAYTTMKAGIVGMTRSFAAELAPLNVTANAVAPSFIPSNFTSFERNESQMQDLIDRHRQITPLPRLAEPEDVANAVAFLASPDASFITGEVLHVCGGGQLAPIPMTSASS